MRYCSSAYFDPVIQKRREQFGSKEDKQRFDDAKRKMEEERHRYHDNCPTSNDIKANVVRDLESRTSRRLNANLRDLGLPTYWDIGEKFLEMCDNYKV